MRTDENRSRTESLYDIFTDIDGALSRSSSALFRNIPNLFRNCLRRRVRTEETKPVNQESSSINLDGSMEMNKVYSQTSNSSNDSETKNSRNESKFFRPKPDFENKYSSDNKRVINLQNPVAEDSTDFDIESSTFH